MTTTVGNCFRCHKPGHWMRDCPLDKQPPSIHCHCGGGICIIKTANTKSNPGRKFYQCPAAQGCKNTFVKWCDQVTDKDIEFRPDFTIPVCKCGAGLCRRFKDGSGNAYYQCCIKKGFGACGYFEWEGVVVEMAQVIDVVDENEREFWFEADMVTNDVETSFKNSVSVEDVSDVAAMDQGVPLIGSSVGDEQEEVVIEPVERWMKTLHVDQVTNSAPFNESCQFNLDDAASGLCSVGDGVSSGSVVTYHVETGTREVEWSSPNLQDIIEQYNSEKQHLDSVSKQHVQELNALMGSYSRLRSLQEKTSHLRKLLLEAEKEMVCCEAETLEFGASCREVAAEIAESQKRMQETAEKLGKGVEVLNEKESLAMKRRKC